MYSVKWFWYKTKQIKVSTNTLLIRYAINGFKYVLSSTLQSIHKKEQINSLVFEVRNFSLGGHITMFPVLP